MLSFIVPAFNEEHELPETLRALRAAADASGENYEIVVVDDASTDATAALATATGARVISVRHRQIAAVRNAGARVSQGDVFFFIDADTRIAPVHITGALAALANGCSGGGARIAFHDAVPGWGRLFARVFCAFYFAANLGAGAFLFTTRRNFEAVGGFDEQYFAGEEVFFTQELKKIGRFELLAKPMLTSGRKLRMHSPRQILMGTFALMIGGKRAVRSRAKLDFWYDGKRERKTT
ncbi:MAG: glycosyltransferase [Chthoniobacterales bacterium]|nr:glycosyltransferase [Chthoniobacterales bacterium]